MTDRVDKLLGRFAKENRPLIGRHLGGRSAPKMLIPMTLPEKVKSLHRVRAKALIIHYGGKRPVSYTHLTLPTICSV
eukprot:5531854-Prorocentrum_lima.AAC.1